jgi:hypothetical protein
MWLNTNTKINDIQIAITRGHHTQTHDEYDSTIKTAFLVRLDKSVKCILRHYKGKLMILKLLKQTWTLD